MHPLSGPKVLVAFHFWTVNSLEESEHSEAYADHPSSLTLWDDKLCDNLYSYVRAPAPSIHLIMNFVSTLGSGSRKWNAVSNGSSRGTVNKSHA